MRIYTAPGLDAYTVDRSSLNVSLTLSPGTYNTLCSRGTTAQCRQNVCDHNRNQWR